MTVFECLFPWRFLRSLVCYAASDALNITPLAGTRFIRVLSIILLDLGSSILSRVALVLSIILLDLSSLNLTRDTLMLSKSLRNQISCAVGGALWFIRALSIILCALVSVGTRFIRALSIILLALSSYLSSFALVLSKSFISRVWVFTGLPSILTLLRKTVGSLGGIGLPWIMTGCWSYVTRRNISNMVLARGALKPGRALVWLIPGFVL